MILLYLGCLTHESVTISADTMPINVGFISAYLEKEIPNTFDVKIFRSPNKLLKAFKEDGAPDVLALSNYVWNKNLSLFFFDYAKRINRNILTVMGGPNFPKVPERQDQVLKALSNVDFYIHQEGELAFTALMGNWLKNDRSIETLKENGVEGCFNVTSKGDLRLSPLFKRVKQLDQFPSPYLTGQMDQFFLNSDYGPFIQTNRGCPFTCTFCHEGDTEYFSTVTKFSEDRVVAELDYIGDRLNGHTVLTIADSNFGMYKQDKLTCQKIRKLQDEKDYPKHLSTNTGKNKPDRILEAIGILKPGTFPFTASVQSMDDQVLKTIKRNNIRRSDYLDVQLKLKKIDPGFNSQAEMIIPLPGETKDTYAEGIRKLIDSGVSGILIYTLMMLEGTELNIEEARWSNNYTTKWRVIPRSYTEIEGVKCIETEEVGVATNDMPFEDYISCRKLALVVQYTYNNGGFPEIVRFLKEKDIDIWEWIQHCYENIEKCKELAPIVGAFVNETASELWDSEEELRRYYSNDNNFQKLLEGEYGANLMQKYWVEGVVYNFDHLVGFVVEMVKDLLFEKNIFDEVSSIELDSLRTWILAQRAGVFSVSTESRYQLFNLSHDVQGWMQNNSGKTLEQFKFESAVKHKAALPSTISKSLEELYERFGTSHQAIGKISTRINAKYVCREIMRA